jgi:hypothetical protein
VVVVTVAVTVVAVVAVVVKAVDWGMVLMGRVGPRRKFPFV